MQNYRKIRHVIKMLFLEIHLFPIILAMQRTNVFINFDNENCQIIIF